MIEILKTQAFSDWFGSLRDREAQRRIQARIDYLAVGAKLAAALKLED